MSGSQCFSFVPPFPPSLLWVCFVFFCLVVFPSLLLEVGLELGGVGLLLTTICTPAISHQTSSTHQYLRIGPALHSSPYHQFCLCGILLWLTLSVASRSFTLSMCRSWVACYHSPAPSWFTELHSASCSSKTHLCPVDSTDPKTSAQYCHKTKGETLSFLVPAAVL